MSYFNEYLRYYACQTNECFSQKCPNVKLETYSTQLKEREIEKEKEQKESKKAKKKEQRAHKCNKIRQ